MIKAKINSKKNKNPISKAMYIKKEELNEIIDILTREEKTLVNEATIKDIFIETYLQAKYYNMFDDKNIEYKGKNISDVLDMTINQAVEFFESVPTILNKIKTLKISGTSC